MPKYFFDISGVVWHLKRVPQFSGIQRAVVMLIDGSAAALGAQNVYVSYLDSTTGRYRALAYSALESGGLTDSDALRSTLGLGRAKRQAPAALRKYQGTPGKYWFHWAMFQLNALAGNERHFHRRNTTLDAWKEYVSLRGGAGKKPAMVAFDSVSEQGDKLILLDATWNIARTEQVFLSAHKRGIETYTMVYDLLPIIVPQFSNGNVPLNFHEWLLRSGDYTSVYLTDSVATEGELARFLQTHDIRRSIHTVPLAQDRLPGTGTVTQSGPMLDRVNAAAYPQLHSVGMIDERIRAMSAHPYVLCVGTRAPHKNNWRLALAWDRLRQQTGIACPRLVFAGRDGWMNRDFDNFIAATGKLYGWIDIIDSPSDAELDHLYRNCLFSAMPSLYEGWGLPVGESLSYGKTAITSSICSLPEVGGDLVEYCDPYSVDSIVAACLRLIADPDRRIALEQKIRGTKLRSWDDVAADLIKAIRPIAH